MVQPTTLKIWLNYFVLSHEDLGEDPPFPKFRNAWCNIENSGIMKVMDASVEGVVASPRLLDLNGRGLDAGIGA